MEYNKLTAEIKGYEDEYAAKVAEAKKAYDELIEKYFYSMRDKIVDVLKDVPQKEFVEWLDKAKDDESIGLKMFMLVQMCWRETHEYEVKVDAPESVRDLAVDLMVLGLLRRLL